MSSSYPLPDLADSDGSAEQSWPDDLMGRLDPACPRTPCFASCLVRNTRMSSRYNAVDIEVLSGLDPVKRRPGMYTDTSRPNHLVQEVVDNSVDEALAGHATSIEVLLHTDGSVSVSDD